MVRRIFSAHRCLDVVYEDLLSDPDATLSAVFEFLGVGGHRAKTTTQKIVDQPMRTAVQNYSAIAEHFAETPYAPYTRILAASATIRPPLVVRFRFQRNAESLNTLRVTGLVKQHPRYSDPGIIPAGDQPWEDVEPTIWATCCGRV
jgi:hypothetical protein